MNTIYMRIHSFEEASNSLIVSFASDTTEHQDPNHYPSYAYQPMTMWPDVTDLDEIKKRIAQAGIWHVEHQVREEQFVADSEKRAQYQAMVGTETTYVVSDLMPQLPDNDPAPVLEV